MSSESQQRQTPEELAALRAQKFSLEDRKKATLALLLDKASKLKPTSSPQEYEVSSLAEPLADETLEALIPDFAIAKHPRSESEPDPEPKPQVTDDVWPWATDSPEPAAEPSALSAEWVKIVEPEPPTFEEDHTAVATKTPIPSRRRSDEEILQLRHRGLMQTRPPIQSILSMQIHPFLAGLLYLFAAAVVFVSIRYWDHQGLTRFYAPASGCLFLLVVSLYLYHKKPRARHHAAFLAAVAFLVIGFVIVFTLKNSYAA